MSHDVADRPQRESSGVPAAVDAVVAEGGGRFGEIVTMQTKDGRHITWVYATDPDGNIVELQAWS